MTASQLSPQNRAISAEEWGPGYKFWQAMVSWLGQRGPDGTTSIVRVASHLVIVAVAVAVLWISRVQLPAWDIGTTPGVIEPAEQAEPQVALANTSAQQASGFVRAPVPITLIPDRPRTELLQHTVQAGDTLYDIADKYHITADTLVWTNNLEDNPDLLRLGQQLTILPTNGVLHIVVNGDTLDSIAKKYSVKTPDIVGYDRNQLDPQNPTVAIGQKLIVPGGVKEMPARPKAPPMLGLQVASAPSNAPRGGGRLVWPAAGSISQTYGRYHAAVDIASYVGAPVKAADAGFIALAGWSNVGYGYYIIVDHGNGYQTLYAHLSKISVKAGQAVDKSAVIGAVGSTGNSTGPHLHFEVRLNGVGQNPFNYLP